MTAMRTAASLAVANGIPPEMWQIGSASTALTGALGPVGVAFAGLTTAIGLYSLVARDAEEQSRLNAEAARAEEEAIRNLGAGYRTTANAIRAARELMNARAAGDENT